MKLNKSPGSDGLTVEFYLFFWPKIGSLVCNSLNYSYKMETLANSQRRGIINLIFKKGEHEDLNNWRPITLLNVDYKIAAFVLSKRLQNVIKKIVSTDQKGYIKGRFGGENIRLIEDIFEYTDVNNLTGALISLDFSKAFDTVNREFMFNTLQ